MTIPKVNAKLNFDTLFLTLLLVAYMVTYLFTLSDYGVSWDEALGELYVGDKYFQFYSSLDSKYLDLAAENIEVYKNSEHPDFYSMVWYVKKHAEHMWGLGPTISAFTKYIFFTKLGLLDPIDAHHISLLGFMLLLLFAVYRFALHVFGRWEAVFATTTIALYPRLWAHAHFNTKDLPSAVLFSLVIITFYLGLKHERGRWLLGSAALWGLALAAKGNALFLPIVLGPWFLIMVLGRILSGKSPISGQSLWALYAYPFVGISVLFAAWPYLLYSFPNNLIKHGVYLFDRGLEGPQHWQIEPLIKAFATMPLPVITLFVIGLGSALYRFLKNYNERSAILLVLLWLIIPVLRVSIPTARDFDGIRHWLEFVPALAIFCGIGACFIMSLVEALVLAPIKEAQLKDQFKHVIALSVLVLWFGPIVKWQVNNHPYQLAYFNSVFGGLGGVQEKGPLGVKFREATDYWGASYRKGLEWLNAHAEPDAYLFVGVAEHIMMYTPPAWIRSDLNYRELDEMLGLIETLPRKRSMYLMYVTRKGHYPKMGKTPEEKLLHQLFKLLDQRVEPAHQVLVDGVPILKIIKIPRQDLRGISIGETNSN